MWNMPPSRGTALVSLLSLTTLANAVALSDFSPQVDNLQGACLTAYQTQIPDCTTYDFTNSQHTCTKKCLAGLVEINALVSTACADADVEETSIVGLFQLGKAIQLLCNVEVVTTTTGLGAGGGKTTYSMTMTRTGSIGTSTMVLSSATPVTTGIVTDSGELGPPTVMTTSTRLPTTSITTTNTPASTSGVIVDTSKVSSVSSTTSTRNPAAAESQKSGNTGSGGGSPFDNINNSGATSLRTTSSFITGILIAIFLSACASFG